MIKAVGASPLGQPLVILGLSGENMTRLMADEPIKVDLSELGVPGNVTVVLIGGRTEDAITEQLKAHGLIDAATEQR